MKRLLAVAALLLAGCGPQPEPGLDSQQQPIINGAPDTKPTHRAVVAVYFNHRYWSFCSGTMIAPGVVLTAAHCAYGRPKDRFEILFGPDARTAVRREVTSLWIHPGYNPHLLGKDDLCLMRFAGGAPAGVEPIPPLPASLALTDEDEGRQIEFVGYGVTEQGQFTTKLTVTTPLTYVCSEALSCTGLGFANTANTICYDETEVGGPCSGDSGGPALVLRQGREYVAGVTSYGDSSCRTYGCSVKVDAFSGWIDAFLAAETPLAEACQDDQECLSGFCADGLCCDYACDNPCEACDLPGQEGHCARVTDDAREPGCGPAGGCASAGLPDRSVAVGLLLAMSAALGLGLLWRRR